MDCKPCATVVTAHKNYGRDTSCLHLPVARKKLREINGGKPCTASLSRRIFWKTYKSLMLQHYSFPVYVPGHNPRMGWPASRQRMDSTMCAGLSAKPEAARSHTSLPAQGICSDGGG